HTRWPRDWSSDVCSSDLIPSHIKSHADVPLEFIVQRGDKLVKLTAVPTTIVLDRHESVGIGIVSKEANEVVDVPTAVWRSSGDQIGRASCRERAESWGGG